MKDLLNAKSLILLLAWSTMCHIMLAQQPNCVETSAIGAMARAGGLSELKARKQKAGDSYRARLVFVARMFEIDPVNKDAAESLLGMLPKDDDGPEQSVWLSLDQLQGCPSGGIPDSDLNPLFHLQERLPRDAANAVLLAPDKMSEYIAYAPISTESVVSDYAVQMRKVCTARHQLFVETVNRLAPKDRSWFVSNIFNPAECRAIALPEQ